MITRLRAVAILHQHSTAPDTCVVMHNCLEDHANCESFNTALGIHSTYSYRSLMNWLGC